MITRGSLTITFALAFGCGQADNLDTCSLAAVEVLDGTMDGQLYRMHAPIEEWCLSRKPLWDGECPTLAQYLGEDLLPLLTVVPLQCDDADYDTIESGGGVLFFEIDGPIRYLETWSDDPVGACPSCLAHGYAYGTEPTGCDVGR